MGEQPVIDLYPAEVSVIARGGRLLLGVDLGASSIKLVEARKTEMGYAIAQWTEVTTPPGAYSDGQIISAQEIGKALKETLKTKYRPGTRQVCASVGGQTALVRRLALPKLPLRRLRELLETQGEQWIPFLREGACFDLAVVDPNLSETEQEVLLVAVPLRHVELLGQALRVAGLQLAALDVDASAHYRAALAGRTVPREGTVAVLDLDQERARLGLFHDGALAVVRTLDAIPYLPEPGEPPPDPMMLEGFAVDVRRSLELMLSQARGSGALGCLVVVSARWPAKELLALLERELQGELGHRLTSEFQVRPGASADTPPGTTQALGLALSEASAPQGLHLLPRLTTSEQRHRSLSTMLSLVILLGAGGYAFYWSQVMPVLERTQAQLQQQLKTHQNYLAREPDVAKEEARAKQLDNLMKRLAIAEPWTSGHTRLKELLPSGMVLNSLSVNPPDIDLAGNAPSPEAVAELMQNLEDSEYFINQALHRSGVQGNPLEFSVSLEMAPVTEGEK